jgi:hypothetical protein
MRLLKLGLRFWFTLASVFSFVSGWILLVHAPKPNQSASLNSAITTTAGPTLEPLPPLNALGGGDDNSSNQSFFSVQPSVRSQFSPAFRTGGS